MMKGTSWFRPGHNDHEASGSGRSRAGGNGGRRIPRAPMPRPPRPPPVPRSERRVNVNIPTARLYAEIGALLPWSCVHLPHGWHLNQARVPVLAIPLGGPARRWEILRRRAHLPPDLRWDPVYAVDSPLWSRWFEAEPDARRQMIEAHLEGLDDDDVDYEAQEAHQPPPPPPVKEEEEDAPPEEEWPGYTFPMPRPGRPDWSQYRGADTTYVELIPWVPAFPPEVYMQAAGGQRRGLHAS